MKIIKNIFGMIFQPLKALSNNKLSNNITKFFSKRNYLIYIIAFFITLLLVITKYSLFNIFE